MSLPLPNKRIDFRISTLPIFHGEKMVLRLLHYKQHLRSITQLGMLDAQQKILHHALCHPQGLILITGPTGSGKTSSLYACVQHLDKPSHHIATVEDPIEIPLEGLSQVQVNLSLTYLLQKLYVLYYGKILMLS